MSVSKKLAQLNEVVRLIEPDARLNQVKMLQGGISADMLQLSYSDNDNLNKVILRIPGFKVLKEFPGIARHEFEVLSHLQGLELSSPVPIFLEEDEHLFGRPFLVLDFIEGEPVYELDEVPGFIEKLASKLVKVHRISETELDFSLFTDQKRRLARTLSKQPQNLDQSIDEGRIRALVNSNYPCESKNEACFLHGDYWPGNILWSDQEIVGLIDWEDAEVGEPLYELAVSRLDIAMIFGFPAMNNFTEAYLNLNPIDLTNMPLYDLIASLRPAGKLDEWAQGWSDLGRDDIDESSMRRQLNQFVANAYGETT